MHYKGFLAALLACMTYAGASSTIGYSTTTTDTVIKAINNNTGGQKKGIVGTASASGGTGVQGRAPSGVGVRGDGDVGVQGVGGQYGVTGTGSYMGVEGTSVNSYGVHGTSEYGQGVRGLGYYSNGATGVSGEGNTGVNAFGGYGSTAYGVNAYSYFSGYHYGIYAYISGPGYAGLFDGDVAVTGACNPCSPSDEKLKKDIAPYSGGLKAVMALKPKTYSMRTEEYKGKLNLAEGKQYGLIAQELEAVLPEMVKEIIAPVQLTPAEREKGVKKDPLKLKGVNYSALVPILIAAIQEQQAEIEALKAGR